MRRLLRGWRIRSHKAVTRARMEELGGRQRTDDWWRYGFHDGEYLGAKDPNMPVTEVTLTRDYSERHCRPITMATPPASASASLARLSACAWRSKTARRSPSRWYERRR